MRATLSSRDVACTADVSDVLLQPHAFAHPDDWRREVVSRLHALLGGDAATFQLPYPDLDLMLSHGLDTELMRTYAKEFVPDLDAAKRYNARIIRIGVGDHERMWSHDLAWYYRSTYFNECLRPGRALDPVWAAAPADGQSLPAILIGHHHHAGPRRFGDRGLAIMRLLQPALRAGVRLLMKGDARWTPDAAALSERFGLTPRQADVALLLAQGMSNKMIARRLAISPYTARNHTEQVLLRLGLASRRQVAAALR